MENQLNFTLFNSIILAGICQGIIFGIIVLSSKKFRNRTTIFLATLIVSFSFSNLQYYLYDTNLISYHELTDIIYIPWASLVGPLLLLYALTFIEPERRISFKIKLLFIPFLLIVAYGTVFKIYVASGHTESIIVTAFPIINVAEEVASFVLNQSITFFLLYKIYKIRKEQHEFDIREIRQRHKWLMITLSILMLLEFLWIYLVYEQQEDSNYKFYYYYPLWIGISFMIYWLGHLGIYKFGILEERKKIRKFTLDKPQTFILAKQKNENIITLEKMLSEEKKFLDPNITLESLAEQLNLSKSYLSRIINSELGMSFTDYVNSQRVEEAKTYLVNPEFSNYTLIAIGLEAGFSSKSAFNKTFKKFTGITPSEYQKQAK